MAISTIKIDGTPYPLGAAAANVAFDSTGTGIEAGTVQAAIEEVKLSAGDNITIKDGVISAVGRTDALLDEAQRLKYQNMPAVILDYIDYDPSSSDVSVYSLVGKTVFTTEGKIRRYYLSSVNPHGVPAVLYTEETPDPGLVYWYKENKTKYRWDETEGELVLFEDLPIGYPVQYLPSTQRIPYDKMACMVLDSMGQVLDNVDSANGISYRYEPAQGDYYYAPGSKIIIHVSDTDVSLSPDKAVIYCNKATGRLYRWDTKSNLMKEVGNKSSGSSGSGSGSSSVAIPAIVGSGDLAAAREAMDSYSGYFAWLLVTTDDDDIEVRKIIWHTGGGVFIDANGAIISE